MVILIDNAEIEELERRCLCGTTDELKSVCQAIRGAKAGASYALWLSLNKRASATRLSSKPRDLTPPA